MFKNRITDIDVLKKKIDAYRPLPKSVLAQLKEYYRIGLTWTSNALEGSSLTETETKVILEDGLTIGGRPMRDHLEAIGHSEAYDFMHTLAAKKGISERSLLELHRLFYYHIDQTSAGKYRTMPVHVTGTDFKFPSAAKIPVLMKDFIKNIPVLRKQCHVVEYAARLHLTLVTIHPFVDGNGRTARLLMNLGLLQHGYAVTIIPPTMRQYYLALVRKGNKGDDRQFIDFITEMVYESQKEYVRLLQ
jgi:Fic family protein